MEVEDEGRDVDEEAEDDRQQEEHDGRRGHVGGGQRPGRFQVHCTRSMLYKGQAIRDSQVRDYTQYGL